MRGETIYRKTKEGKYVPVGVEFPEFGSALPEGIWYVRSSEHSRMVTNVGSIGLFTKKRDLDLKIPETVGIIDIVDGIMRSKEWSELLDSGINLQQVLNLAVKLIYKKYGRLV